jgi:methylated-DNA-[protein]-cysteine S-methyltransferase
MNPCTTIYTDWYVSPLGRLLVAAQDHALIGLWFDAQMYFPTHITENSAPNHHLLKETKAALDAYFKKAPYAFTLPCDFLWGTAFQQRVWRVLSDIPSGMTCSYGDIGARLGLAVGSARAVGAAIGRNPIGIIIPCHRVVGRHGQLTGYAGGLDRKTWLLRHEGSLLT